MENNSTVTPLLGKRYQLLQSVATGGMAIVYKAQDLWLERPVAIKILRNDYSSDAGFRQRFHHEAKAAANLVHPNIVTVFDFGLDGASLFIVMEYVPGSDLKAIIKEHGPFKPEEALPLIIQACAGIGYAHRSGLVHCDIKPQNMLVTPDRRLKVTDFGIARALASISEDEQNEIVWGSPQYFSPEQAAGSAPSPASDVYSIGVILYEMLTGRLPFVASDALDLARMHREARPTPPHRLNPTIPLELEQILLKVLAKEPSSRYRTADQLGRVLENFSQKLTSSPPTRSAVPSKDQAYVLAATQAPSRPITQPTADAASSSRSLSQPMPSTANSSFRPAPLNTQAGQVQSEEDHSLDIDWLTTGLGLLCAIAVGGLVPFWLYIWFLLRSVNP
jgi:eukaryotic-like serine/threonine-protein kinase